MRLDTRNIDFLEKGSALQSTEKLVPAEIHWGFVSGHDFSRATKRRKLRGL
jgi:hypothetical protein